MNESIDIEYDLRTDANGGDVDKCSGTLRKYHKVLWSKNLPNGKFFNLLDTVKDEYLFFQNDNQGIRLSSDWIVNTYSHWTSFEILLKQINKEEIENFSNIAHTIGGRIIFPLNPINTQGELSTINQERGKNGKIADRFDITLECIKRYYNNETSPLGETLQRYDYYFKLFMDFKGYCDFFLLQDLILNDYSKIKFFLPFDDFEQNPYPKTVKDYLGYKEKSIEFVKNRNKRIQDYVKSIS